MVHEWFYISIVFALRDQLASTGCWIHLDPSGSGAEELQAQKALKLFSLIASSRRVTLLGADAWKTFGKVHRRSQ